MTTVELTEYPSAVAALVAVIEAPIGGEDQTSKMAHLLGTMADALGGRAAVLLAADDREGRFTVVDSLNLHGPVEGLEDAPLEDGVSGQAHGEGRELVVDEAAGPGALPEAFRAAGMVHAVALPVRSGERALGLVWVAGPDPLSDDPLRRHAARLGAERVGFMLERNRLYETLERAMAQILETDERMLGRIGLDIHDGPTQQLSVALLELQLLEADLSDVEAAGARLPEKLRPALGRMYETLGGALHEMRELIGHLRPAQFDNRTLPEVLQDAVVAYEALSGGRCETRMLGDFRHEAVSLSQKITFYRILQEALTNAHRHGEANEVVVTVREGPAGVTLEVRDNGRGFDPEAVPRPRPGNPQARFGIFGMRDRAQLLGGSVQLWSQLGVGTHVTVFLPRWRRTDRSPMAQLGR